MRQFAAGKGATFQLMEKIDVNGVKTSPVWQYLKKEKPGDVKWNFDAKFLIDKQGNVVERFSDGPASREAKIAELLA